MILGVIMAKADSLVLKKILSLGASHANNR